MTRIHLCNKMVVYIKWEMNEEKMDYRNYIEIRKISLLYYQYCLSKSNYNKEIVKEVMWDDSERVC